MRRVLRTKPYISAHPVNLLQLGAHGFDAWPVEGAVAELKRRIHDGAPVIAFLWTGSLQHWANRRGVDYLHAVVVAGYDEATVLIYDPVVLQDGPLRIEWSEFKEAWQYSRQMMAVIEPHRAAGVSLQ